MSKESEAVAFVPSVQPSTSTSTDDQIVVGVEASTLPPISSKDQLAEASDELFNNLQGYITSEIERMFCKQFINLIKQIFNFCSNT